MQTMLGFPVLGNAPSFAYARSVIHIPAEVIVFVHLNTRYKLVVLFEVSQRLPSVHRIDTAESAEYELGIGVRYKKLDYHFIFDFLLMF